MKSSPAEEEARVARQLPPLSRGQEAERGVGGKVDDYLWGFQWT